MDRYLSRGLIILVVMFLIWWRGWRIRCWIRRRHHWLIPDVAIREGMADTAFPGVCRDCGLEVTHSGETWTRITRANG